MEDYFIQVWSQTLSGLLKHKNMLVDLLGTNSVRCILAYILLLSLILLGSERLFDF